MFKNNLGNKEIMSKNIQKYMSLNGIDRNKICKDLDIKYTTFSDWVNAKTYPRIDKIELMANYFGINKSDLVEDNNITSEEIKEQQQIKTIAAHFDGDMTEEEMNEIINYVKYVKSKRK